MKKFNALAVALLVSVGAFAQATWTVDKSHSKLGFSVTHLLVSEVEGSFKITDAKITTPKDDFSNAVVEFSADPKTVNTDNADRDKHLQSPDFLDVDKNPAISFKSTSFTKVDDKNYKVVGNLTLHGVTKPVTLNAVLNGTAVHPYNKKTIAGFKITGQLKRSEFGIGEKTPSAVVSDEVNIVANAEFVKG